MDKNKSTSCKGTVVFLAFEALGHIHPLLSIVKELSSRGYRAPILTIRPLGQAPKLKSQGFEIDYCFKEEETSELAGKVGQVMQKLAQTFRQGLPKVFESTYSLEGIGKYMSDIADNHSKIEAKLKSFRPDLVVVDHVILVPCAYKVASKWVRFYSGFPLLLITSYNENCVAGLGLKLDEMTPDKKEYERKFKGPLREKTRRFAAEMGITDWPLDLDLVPTSPYLNFYLGPQELSPSKIPKFKPLPDVWYQLEHTLSGELEEATPFNVPDTLQKLPGKLIYFSLGTLVSNDAELVNRLLEIFSKSPNKFIISKGPMHEQIKLYPNMWGDKFVDQKGVLPKVDLFITHGGHNSIIEAFYYGVPGLIVLPVFADQFDSAQRIEDCGFGVRLNPFNCTQNDLLKSIDRLLSNEELCKRMKTISARLRSIKYHQIAADKLESLLKD